MRRAARRVYGCIFKDRPGEMRAEREKTNAREAEVEDKEYLTSTVKERTRGDRTEDT